MSEKYCLDADSLIRSWCITYKPHMFSPLWEQLSESKDNIVLIKPIFDEIDPISSADKKLLKEEFAEKFPIKSWLIDKEFMVTMIGSDVEALSLKLEFDYQISEFSGGASKNDIALISYALKNNCTVVTMESPQPHKPGKKSNYKIPLICQENGVRCIDFVSFLEHLGIKL